MNYEQLHTIVFEAMGYVSMCWNPRPTGVFESTQAETKGNEVMEAIKAYA